MKKKLPGPRSHVGPMFDTAALAKKLGVDESKLKDALDQLESEHRAEEKKRHDELAQKLADRLGVDVDKVKEALPEGPAHDWGLGPKP